MFRLCVADVDSSSAVISVKHLPKSDFLIRLYYQNGNVWTLLSEAPYRGAKTPNGDYYWSSSFTNLRTTFFISSFLVSIPPPPNALHIYLPFSALPSPIQLSEMIDDSR